MATPDNGKPLWHGRFEHAPSHELMAFTESLSFDKLLWRQDVVGSTAHVRMLNEVGLLNDNETTMILDALRQVASEFESESFVYVESDEDIHTAVERRVTEIAGTVGGKLHTGRSRNDQSVTGVRLWCKDAIVDIAQRVVKLQHTLAQRSEDAGEAQIAGYTHLQRAQPVLLAHQLLAHGWTLARDVDRLVATLDRMDVSPLGAGALAGSSLPINPELTASLLGFAKPFDNSLDAVSDRDFIAEILFDIALLGVHLSRLGEEWVLWTTEEFGYAKLADEYSTGSSMMPNKKNPDIAELTRGKSGRLIGDLTGFLATLKGLPLAYNRDLQEDKEPLFDAVKNVSLALSAIDGMIATATFNIERMAEAASAQSLVATDLAEWLVERGMPFREAHAVVGNAVRESLEPGSPTFAEIVLATPSFGSEAATLFEPRVALARRVSRGGSGFEAVKEQRARFATQLQFDIDRLNKKGSSS